MEIVIIVFFYNLKSGDAYQAKNSISKLDL